MLLMLRYIQDRILQPDLTHLTRLRGITLEQLVLLWNSLPTELRYVPLIVLWKMLKIMLFQRTSLDATRFDFVAIRGSPCLMTCHLKIIQSYDRLPPLLQGWDYIGVMIATCVHTPQGHMIAFWLLGN